MKKPCGLEHDLFIFISKKYDAAIADFKSAIQQAETDGNSLENDIHALQSELKKAEAALKGTLTLSSFKLEYTSLVDFKYSPVRFIDLTMFCGRTTSLDVRNYQPLDRSASERVIRELNLINECLRANFF